MGSPKTREAPASPLAAGRGVVTPAQKSHADELPLWSATSAPRARRFGVDSFVDDRGRIWIREPGDASAEETRRKRTASINEYMDRSRVALANAIREVRRS